MATKDIHEEISKWKNLDNLIGWKKQQYSSLFPHIYWLMGIALLGISYMVFQAKEIIIQSIGIWSWALIVLALTLLFIYMLFKIGGAHKIANENVEYLYRKKDGQDV